MTNSNHPIDWNDQAALAPNLRALYELLERENGMAGLNIFAPSDTSAIVDAFRRDGFVVVSDVLSAQEIAALAAGCDEVITEVTQLDASKTGNRGSHRYSFGGSSLTRSQLHRPAWQMLLEVTRVGELVSAIFESDDYLLRAASGDFCLSGATEYQPLHADVRDFVDPSRSPFSAFRDPRGFLTIADLPCPYICVNFMPQDITRLNGPTRQIPGTQNSRARIPRLEQEPQWMRLSTVCPVPAGSIMIRDTRAWHGGTPNLTNATRSIPNLEFYAPWFREPMVPGISYTDYKNLSARAQRLVRHAVADSSETLETGTTLVAP